MRFLTSAVTSLLLGLSAASLDGLVYLSDTNGAPESAALSPGTSRLIFAQRLGLGQTQNILDADDKTIEALNDFGGRPRKLFGQNGDRSRPKAFIMIEGVEDAKDIMSETTTPSFIIPAPPGSSENLGLMLYFNEQSTKSQCSDWSSIYNEVTPVLDAAKDMAEAGLHVAPFFNQGRLMVKVKLQAKTNAPDAFDRSYSSIAGLARSFVDSVKSRSQANDWDTVIALMPTSAASGKISKRAEPSTWGLDLGSGRPDFLPGDLNHNTNGINPPHSPAFSEDIYVDHPSSSSASSSEHKGSWLDALYPFNSADDDDVEDPTPAWKAPAAEVSAALDYILATNTTAPKGILPACYATQSACDAATHSCSGHGACSLKFKDPDSPSNKGACYSCMCSPTKRKNKDGTVKTTKWSGPACQKVDVSFEFWLLGSVTVGLLSVIAWGIGLLMSMGSQELPSVIGAGVAGPRAKQ